MKYPGKILAIPGNQDGETFTVTDPKPLQAFLDNFCAPKAGVPKTASNVGIFREMVAQPGVYWLLKAPFLNLIGLYSNIVPETCAAPATITNRSKWLQATLTDLKKAKDAGDNRVLVITMHHPVFSEGGHSGSDFMLGQIDQVCTAAGIVPHALLAGHTHTYQRYTRTISRPMAAQMICIDAGCGGHAASSVKAASGQARRRCGFCQIAARIRLRDTTASKTQLVLEMFQTSGGRKTSFDRVTMDIASHRVT